MKQLLLYSFFYRFPNENINKIWKTNHNELPESRDFEQVAIERLEDLDSNIEHCQWSHYK